MLAGGRRIYVSTSDLYEPHCLLNMVLVECWGIVPAHQSWGWSQPFSQVVDQEIEDPWSTYHSKRGFVALLLNLLGGRKIRIEYSKTYAAAYLWTPDD